MITSKCVKTASEKPEQGWNWINATYRQFKKAACLLVLVTTIMRAVGSGGVHASPVVQPIPQTILYCGDGTSDSTQYSVYVSIYLYDADGVAVDMSGSTNFQQPHIHDDITGDIIGTVGADMFIYSDATGECIGYIVVTRSSDN